MPSKSRPEKKSRNRLDTAETVIMFVMALTKVKENKLMDTFTEQRIRLLQFLGTLPSYRPGLILEAVA